MKYHMLSHTGKKPFTCKQCNYSCKGSRDLKMHMEKHNVKRNSTPNRKKHTTSNMTEIILYCKICFIFFIQPILTTSTGRGGAAMVFCGEGRGGAACFPRAGPCSAGRPSLRRISCVAKHIIHLGSWFWKKFHKTILFKWLRPLWQNLCLFMKVVLVKYFLHFSQNLRF